MLALLNRPRLVILDELTQGLDPAARREVWAAVAQLHDEGTTVLLVTHELDEAEALCGRVIAMRGGRVLDQGRPADLVARHAGGAIVAFSADRPGWPTRAAGCPASTRVAWPTGASRCAAPAQVIAQVGAELVRRGPVPADLDVELPDLESALLHLLDDDNPMPPVRGVRPRAGDPMTTALSHRRRGCSAPSSGSPRATRWC